MVTLRVDGTRWLRLPDLPRTVWTLSRGGGGREGEPAAAPGVEPVVGAAASEECLVTGDPQALVAREQRT